MGAPGGLSFECSLGVYFCSLMMEEYLFSTSSSSSLSVLVLGAFLSEESSLNRIFYVRRRDANVL